MNVGPEVPDLRPRLLGLEAGRFVAALLVACFHFSYAFQHLRGVDIFGMAFRGGHAGVEYFFVLSGFIITWVHARDLGSPRAMKPFIVKRLVRLYPMFIVVTVAMLALFLLPSVSAHRDFSIPSFLLDITLLPTGGSTMVEQSWSLRHEMVFYALFAVAVWNIRVGLVALAVWQLASLGVGLAAPDRLSPALMPFLYFYNIGFGAGAGVAWVTRRFVVARPGLYALAGLVLFASGLAVECGIGRNLPPAVLPLGARLSPALYITASALVIFGVTQLEMRCPLPGARVLKLLGGASYALYLVHAVVGSIVIRVFDHSILSRVPNGLVFLAMVLAALLVALGLHLIIERPLLGWLRLRLLAGRSAKPHAGHKRAFVREVQAG